MISLVPSSELSSINKIGNFNLLTITLNKKIIFSFSFNVGIITNNTSSSYFASVRPIADDTYSLVVGFYRWDNVYATYATIKTSYVREKENINDTKLGLDFLKDLRPVSYEWKKKKDNKTNQTHYGLIAQEVVESLKKHGIDSIEDFGGIVHEGDPKGLYGARYEEFVPILIKAVQELSEEIKQLKEDQ